MYSFLGVKSMRKDINFWFYFEFPSYFVLLKVSFKKYLMQAECFYIITIGINGI